MDKHENLRSILIKYGCPEFGDVIIDEICELFEFPTTTEEGDYAHCANCDAVINMDHDTFTVKDDRTLCGNCS